MSLQRLVDELGLAPTRRGLLEVEVGDVRVIVDIARVRVTLRGCTPWFEATTKGERCAVLGFVMVPDTPWWVVGEAPTALASKGAARLAASGARVVNGGVEWSTIPTRALLEDAVDLLVTLRPVGSPLSARSVEALAAGTVRWRYPLLAARPQEHATSLLQLGPHLEDLWPEWREEVLAALRWPDVTAVERIFDTDDTVLREGALRAVEGWPLGRQLEVCQLATVFRHAPTWWASVMSARDELVIPEDFGWRRLVRALEGNLHDEPPTVIVGMVAACTHEAPAQARSLVVQAMGDRQGEAAGERLAEIVSLCTDTEVLLLAMEAGAEGRGWDCLAGVFASMTRRAIPLRTWWESFLSLAEAAGPPPSDIAVALSGEVRVRGGSDHRSVRWIRLVAKSGAPPLQAHLRAWLADTSDARLLIACLDGLGVVGGAESLEAVRAYDSFFNASSVRAAARRATSAIQERARHGSGRLSMVDGQGGISRAED